MISKLIRLDLHSRKVCFGIAVSHCCTDPVSEKERFKVEVMLEGDYAGICLITYPIFELSIDGKMCIVLDDGMSKLCPGRYLFRIIFDECVIVEDVRFQWGGRPVLTDISCESDKGGGLCTDDPAGSRLPDSCCKPECTPLDPCDKCRNPCDCEE